MSDWNLFVREAMAGNFRRTRSLAIRSLSRGAGSEQCRQESGRRVDFKNLELVGREVAEKRVVWCSKERWRKAYL